MASQHTPGPYRKARFNGQWGTAIYALDANGDDEWHLADVKTVVSSDEREANADLFVAAPDMLAALKAALPHVERLASFNPTTVENTMRVRQARKDRDAIVAAIAKAEGRS